MAQHCYCSSLAYGRCDFCTGLRVPPQVFRNKHFTKRDYECTNVVACVAGTAPNENYVPAEESLLDGLTQLWIEGGVRYYGWL